MIQKTIPIIHQTDLFHPHNDLDDHWDLACQYALAKQGNITLKGVLLDYPVNPAYGDPSIQAVNQLNYLTGMAVPVGIGFAQQCHSERDLKRMIYSGKGKAGADMVLDILKNSADPVCIHIVGSCRDIVAAAYKAPELFSRKCRAVYLNAGASNPQSPMEYNVELDPYTYSKIFSLPCPVYWMPCFDMLTEPFCIGEFGTFYKFHQGDILAELDPSLQNYFLFALTRTSDSKWLTYLNRPVDQNTLSYFCSLYRNMWCTAGFFHAAGKTILRSGEIADLGERRGEEIFTFEPISVTCTESGITDWKMDASANERYIFHIRYIESYQTAMVKAMKQLLLNLP